MHPQLELLEQIIRMIGWPSLIGAVIWMIRKWDASQREFRDMCLNTKTTVQGIAEVAADVENLKSNHIAHLQQGIDRVASSNDKAVDVLQNIDSGIKLLIDRTPRA